MVSHELEYKVWCSVDNSACSISISLSLSLSLSLWLSFCLSVSLTLSLLSSPFYNKMDYWLWLDLVSWQKVARKEMPQFKLAIIVAVVPTYHNITLSISEGTKPAMYIVSCSVSLYHHGVYVYVCRSLCACIVCLYVCVCVCVCPCLYYTVYVLACVSM